MDDFWHFMKQIISPVWLRDKNLAFLPSSIKQTHTHKKWKQTQQQQTTLLQCSEPFFCCTGQFFWTDTEVIAFKIFNWTVGGTWEALSSITCCLYWKELPG